MERIYINKSNVVVAIFPLMCGYWIDMIIEQVLAIG